MTFYNEFDRHKAAWLRELQAANEITTGEVDERSIKDVRADELRDFRRCHFFAGVGVWDYALRLAGWPAGWPIWTASCPCQPFSSAGKRKGTEDDRHLWPWLIRLIGERHPHVVIGEQVSSADGLAWFGDVRRDLEAADYTVGALDTSAAGVGAPHARQRLYWCALRIDGLADLPKPRLEEWRNGGIAAGSQRATAERGGLVGRLAAATIAGFSQWDGESTHRQQDGRAFDGSERLGVAGLMGHATGRGCGERGDAALAGRGGYPDGAGCADGVGDSERPEWRADQREQGRHWEEAGRVESSDRLRESGFTRGHWAGADWVLTRPKRVGDLPSLRPIKPGAFPLANGVAGRVGLLRGAGDAIVATQAAAFIRCVMEEILEATR